MYQFIVGNFYSIDLIFIVAEACVDVM